MTWNGNVMVCDSQYVLNTGMLRADAIAVTSRTSLLLPIPAGPTMLTTPPRPR